MPGARWEVQPLVPERWPAFEALLSESGPGARCWCMYWRLGPRYHERPRTENKRDLCELAAAEPPAGLLAFDGAVAVGWCLVAPRAELAWLAHARYLAPVDANADASSSGLTPAFSSFVPHS